MAFIIPQRPSYDISTRHLNISNPSATQAFGVLSRTGEPVVEALHYRGGRCLTDVDSLKKRYAETNEFETFSGRWFYGGILFPHFGHFLTESLHRLRRYIESPDRYEGIIFLKSPQAGTFSYDPLAVDFIRSVLSEYLRISLDRIVVTETFLEIETLDCFPQEQQLGGAPNLDYVEFLGTLENQFVERPQDKRSSEKIFLSRKNYLHAGRTLGMRAIEKVFSENGFEIISPEDHTIKQQFNFISNATTVICEAGSALHLFDVLGKQVAELVVMSRRGFDAHYWRNLYGSRVSRFLAFDKALPMHHYFGTTPGAGHSLYHVQFLLRFLKDFGLDFNQEVLVAEIRQAVNDDIQELAVGFSKTTG